MEVYRQSPFEGFEKIKTIKETLLDATYNPETENNAYALSPASFIDVVENRIQVVDFCYMSHVTARIFSLPNRRDDLERVKVALTISPERSLKQQGESLVHEMIHVDRNVWDMHQGIPFGSELWYWMRDVEELLTRNTAHPALADLALNHLWQRRENL